MAIQNFDDKFLKHYGITDIFQPAKKGGQKMVHFVVRKGEQQVLKIFHYGRDARFDREIGIYEKFKANDGIPKLFAVDEYEGEALIFEQFIEGDTLSDIAAKYMGKEKKISTLLKQVFGVMTPIWNEKYVHRDMNPQNIRIRPAGTPVILDFGIARDLGATSLTGTGQQVGTMNWASPEQFLGKKDQVSYRTDFFGIGLIGYFLLHGNLPFGNTVDEIEKKFNDRDESFNVDPACTLKKYFTESLKFSPAERPREISDLFNLL